MMALLSQRGKPWTAICSEPQSWCLGSDWLCSFVEVVSDSSPSTNRTNSHANMVEFFGIHLAGCDIATYLSGKIHGTDSGRAMLLVHRKKWFFQSCYQLRQIDETTITNYSGQANKVCASIGSIRRSRRCAPFPCTSNHFIALRQVSQFLRP